MDAPLLVVDPDVTPRDTGKRGLARWNRFTFRFFGPPSVGRYDGPYPQIDRDPACPSCGQRESSHQSFRTRDGKTLRRCPGLN